MQVVLTKSGFEKASLGTASMLSYNFQWPQPAVEVCAGLAALCHTYCFTPPLPSPPLSTGRCQQLCSSPGPLGRPLQGVSGGVLS